MKCHYKTWFVSDGSESLCPYLHVSCAVHHDLSQVPSVPFVSSIFPFQCWCFIVNCIHAQCHCLSCSIHVIPKAEAVRSFRTAHWTDQAGYLTGLMRTSFQVDIIALWKQQSVDFFTLLGQDKTKSLHLQIAYSKTFLHSALAVPKWISSRLHSSTT